jgi:aspartate kinase
MATDFIKLSVEDEPEVNTIAENIGPLLSEQENVSVWVTQGFICRDHKGAISNLKRGGSDFTASLIGAAIRAEEIQIWTDIDGMHNNDPRVVKNTKPIAKLSFNEAAELAYFGAKILHPATIQPAKQAEINVKIKNTLSPEMPGTLITRVKRPKEASVKAIAAKDNITAIKIRSSRMLMAYGFLRKVFEVFEKFKTPIDMITTSEVAVSLTIDDLSNLYELISELETFGEVEVDYDQSIVCIVGNMVVEDKGLVAKIFNSLDQSPIRMISYGGSRNNISVLIPSDHKNAALNALNKGLFTL